MKPKIHSKYKIEEFPKVIYEDDNFYGVFKPAGWIVFVGDNDYGTSVHNPDNFKRLLIQNWLHKNLDYSLNDSLEQGYGISNRLDKETSGIIIVAKNLPAYRYIRSEINNHKNTTKVYFTLVHGMVYPKMGVIKLGIQCRKVRKSFICDTSLRGRRAITYYKVMSYLENPESGEKFSFLMVRIITGVTHQIRVHMRSQYHNIVMDPQYYRNKANYYKNKEMFPRLFLHAYYYSFLDPEGEKVEIISSLPEDLKDGLKKLKKIDA